MAGGNTVAVLAGIARLATRAPGRMIALALLVVVGTAAFGIPVAGRLSAGGLTDPGAQSSRVKKALLASTFKQGGDMPPADHRQLSGWSQLRSSAGGGHRDRQDARRFLHRSDRDLTLDRSAVRGGLADQ